MAEFRTAQGVAIRVELANGWRWRYRDLPLMTHPWHGPFGRAIDAVVDAEHTVGSMSPGDPTLQALTHRDKVY